MCWIHVKENIDFPNYKLRIRICVYGRKFWRKIWKHESQGLLDCFEGNGVLAE